MFRMSACGAWIIGIATLFWTGVSTTTFGSGKGGNLMIKANTLLVRDRAYVSADTFGAGKGGNLTVDAQDVQLIGTSSSLYASAQPNSTGD